MDRLTMKSRPLAQLCSCGRPAVQYMTSEGIKVAPYCQDCGKQSNAHHR